MDALTELFHQTQQSVCNKKAYLLKVYEAIKRNGELPPITLLKKQVLTMLKINYNMSHIVYQL
jgi:hypothetical protein